MDSKQRWPVGALGITAGRMAGATGRAGLLLAAAAVVAACANPRPAPVVNRTQMPPLPAPVAVQPPPAPTAVSPTAPGPAGAQPGQVGQAGQPLGEAAAVEVSPIRSGGIETGPLSGAAAPDPNLRTGPQGIKRPYEEVATAVPTTAPATVTATPTLPPPPPPPPPAARTPEPAAAGGSGLLDGVAFGWPSGGSILQNFDETSSKGVSLGGKAGDVVRAAADGRVIFSGAGPRGYGNLIIVKHQNELLSVYAHNRSLAVKEGENVKRGQKIAELGNSGTDTPKLHFEIRQQGKPIDPLAVLPRR
jgi:lipoprotein NlpD